MTTLCLLQNEHGVRINIRPKQSSIEWCLLDRQPTEPQPVHLPDQSMFRTVLDWISAPFIYLFQWIKRLEFPNPVFPYPAYSYPVFAFGGSFIMLYPEYYPLLIEENEEAVALPTQPDKVGDPS
jgi:hypothetical protein